MKQVLCLVLLLLSSASSYSQSNWITKQVGNNISVKFPNNPTYKLIDKSGTYTSKTSNSLIVVIVKYDVLPNYSEFVKLSDDKQSELIEVFLDNAISGLLKATGNEGHAYYPIQVGKLRGREASYSSINPSTGENAKKYCKILYAFNKVYTFQCMYLSENSTSETEKETFLNSIKAN